MDGLTNRETLRTLNEPTPSLIAGYRWALHSVQAILVFAKGRTEQPSTECAGEELLQEESAALLNAAAELLSGNPATVHDKRDKAGALLSALGYASLDEDAKSKAATLLRVGGRLERVFQLAAPQAPGLWFFGGEADPACLGLSGTPIPKASLAGSGLELHKALEACLGEGAEFLSQVERETDVVHSGAPSVVDHRLDEGHLAALRRRLDPAPDDTPSIDWIAARHFGHDDHVLLPADLVLRRSSLPDRPKPLVKLGLGCSAGPTLDQAILGAVLELVERDATALWWNGGHRPRPVDARVLQQASMQELIDRVRAGDRSRTTWFLDISSDIDVTVIAAVSLEADGFGFAFGLSAQLDPVIAVKKAFMELCQTELAYHIVDMKRRERGAPALNDADRIHLDRRGWTGARHSSRLRPMGRPHERDTRPAQTSQSQLAWLDVALHKAGTTVFWVDLTRPDLGIPTVWAGSPQLQPLPAKIATKRLSNSSNFGIVGSEKIPFELL